MAVLLVAGATLGMLSLLGRPGDGSAETDRRPSAGTASQTASGPSASAADGLTAEPSGAPPTSAANQPATPAPTAGPLSSGDVPAPGDLGQGWRLAVIQDDPEAGTIANGTAFAQRNVDEVLALAVPLGCEQRSLLPRPAYVLEGNLVRPKTGNRAVSLAMRFGSAGEAKRFLDLRWRDVLACSRQPKDPYTGTPPPVSRVVVDRSSGDLSARTDPYLPAAEGTWTEVFVAHGAQVTAVAVNLRLTSPDLPDLPAIAARIAAKT